MVVTSWSACQKVTTIWSRNVRIPHNWLAYQSREKVLIIFTDNLVFDEEKLRKDLIDFLVNVQKNKTKIEMIIIGLTIDKFYEEHFKRLIEKFLNCHFIAIEEFSNLRKILMITGVVSNKVNFSCEKLDSSNNK